LDEPETQMTLAPYSLKDAPSLIETVFPVGRISAEAYKERKAGAGQTLTALGSYWKGRKPLILCRAVTLGCLLPATDNPAADLDIFLALLAMDDAAFGRRFQGSVGDFVRAVGEDAAGTAVDFHDEYGQPLRRPRWRDDLDEDVRAGVMAEALAVLPYSIESRLKVVKRPEELDEHALLRPVWPRVNAHLGTSASSLPELLEQLGVARFGRRPKLADTFSGGGSIPFEAARIGCDVYASDLNPIACMLTWGAFNIIGASPERRAEIEAGQAEVAAKVDAEITALGIEHDAEGNRAKAYLYCMETRCPKTGWLVPMAPSWVISRSRGVVARLVPDHAAKRYEILIDSGVTEEDIVAAAKGTVQGGRLVHPMNPDKSGVEIKIIRGDRPGGGNALRLWAKDDFVPHPEDIWQERLYCIQWISKNSLEKTGGRIETFFSGVTNDDLKREQQVEDIVRENLASWQAQGFVPDMAIETGKENEGPIRTNGWTYWHHLFGSRQLLILSLYKKLYSEHHLSAELLVVFSKVIDFCSKLGKWDSSLGSDKTTNVFGTQALQTFFCWGQRAHIYLCNHSIEPFSGTEKSVARYRQSQCDAKGLDISADLMITDPPYADAVHYHEITEYFIAWLRKNPPTPFDQWTWDSQRSKAIKGKDADFRRSMVEAYSAMTAHMSDNGLQVVMFTHQDAGVWADLAGILWAAGLRVTAAWNVVTETESALKDGNYVQGTVCLVLRKRHGTANARQMELEAEIEDEVKGELARLTGLDEGWQNYRGAEALYTDGDLTLAAYAAALRVITRYATIDRREVGSDVFRDLKKGEKTQLRSLIDYAESVANRELVPRGFDKALWRNLEKASRFYVRMLDMEARGAPKVADFQNFARSFALADHTRLMAETRANNASLAGAEDLKAKLLKDFEIAGQPLFQLLFALWKAIEKNDPLIGVTQLRTHYGSDYWQLRQTLIALAEYLAVKTTTTRPDEAAAAAELAEALKVDRL
jgi:putative DNA methylase